MTTERETDLERFIAQKGVGTLTTTPEGKELLKEYLGLKSHLGLRFENAAGELIECWQLLDDTNHAVAVADFRDGTLERFDSAAGCLNRAKKWVAELRKANAVACIIPRSQKGAGQ